MPVASHAFRHGDVTGRNALLVCGRCSERIHARVDRILIKSLTFGVLMLSIVTF